MCSASLPGFLPLIDETTDVSIVKQMIIYGHYICEGCKGEAKTRFLGVVELSDGTAVIITDALLQISTTIIW